MWASIICSLLRKDLIEAIKRKQQGSKAYKRAKKTLSYYLHKQGVAEYHADLVGARNILTRFTSGRYGAMQMTLELLADQRPENQLLPVELIVRQTTTRV